MSAIWDAASDYPTALRIENGKVASVAARTENRRQRDSADREIVNAVE